MKSLLLLAAAAAAPLPAPTATPAAAPGCLADGSGYLRARLRGAVDLDLAWRDPELHCEGGARPDGSGLRVTIAGPAQSNGRRLRFVFGIAAGSEGVTASARPTNLTLIFEGEQRLFATLGEERCTTETLHQQRIGALGGAQRSWKIEASGFCTAPAQTLDGSQRVLVTRFDYAARITFEDSPDARTSPAPR
jgi:hypothetical protein